MSYLPNRAPQVTTSTLMNWLQAGAPIFQQGGSLPSSATNGDFFLLTSVNPNVYYQFDTSINPPNGAWVNLGPVGNFQFGNLPTGQGPIQLYDTKSQTGVNLFVIYDPDTPNPAPLLMTDQGFVVKKDISAGGEVMSEQGALILGYGWTGSGSPTALSPPLIQLFSSNMPIQSGANFPTGMNNQAGALFNKNGVLYIWSGNTNIGNNGWIESETTDFSGFYDTLFLLTNNGYTPANLDLGNLTCHSAVEPGSDNTSSIGTSTNMFQNMYTRSLIIGNNSITPTREYLTFSIDNTYGTILTMTSSSSSGSIIPAQSKTLNLGSSSNPWSNIYSQSLTVNNPSSTPLSINSGSSSVLACDSSGDLTLAGWANIGGGLTAAGNLTLNGGANTYAEINAASGDSYLDIRVNSVDKCAFGFNGTNSYVVSYSGNLLLESASGSVNTAKNTLDDGSGNVVINGSIFLQNSGGSGGYNGGVNLDVNGNLHFMGGTSSNSWNVFSSYGSLMFRVWNNTSSGGSKVATYNNTLDDGSGNMTLAGWLSANGSKSLNPVSDNTYALGSGSYAWAGLVAYSVYANTYESKSGSSGPITISSSNFNVDSTGDLTLAGNCMTSLTATGTSTYGYSLSPYYGTPYPDIGMVINSNKGSLSFWADEWGVAPLFGFYESRYGALVAQINSSGNLTLAGNLTVNGSWLGSASTLYIGGSSGAAVTLIANGNFNPINSSYGLGSGGTPWAGIVANNVYDFNLSSSGNHAVYATSGGQLTNTASSQRYKQNIETLTDCSWVYSLRPVSFDWKNQQQVKEDGRQIGFIAEEVYAINPQLVWLNAKGQPEGVHYEKLGVPLVVELQKLKQRIATLENQLKQNHAAA